MKPKTYQPYRSTNGNRWTEHPFVNGKALCSCGARLRQLEDPRGPQPIASGRYDDELCARGREALRRLVEPSS